jgi:hypothetical protein
MNTKKNCVTFVTGHQLQHFASDFSHPKMSPAHLSAVTLLYDVAVSDVKFLQDLCLRNVITVVSKDEVRI